MTSRVLAVLLAAVAVLGATCANARPRHHHARAYIAQGGIIDCDKQGCHGSTSQPTRGRRAYVSTGPVHSSGLGPRPSRWCGWFMRGEVGSDPGREYNLAANWRHYGSTAAGPAIGVIVVWWHHVGIIVGKTATGWVVKSGNDGHAVRERERSLRGVIAYRWPGGRIAGL